MAKPKADEHAAPFFGFAPQYYQAANELLDLHKADRLLQEPIYFLYSHAVEMAFKAFLRAHDVRILGTPWAREKGHSLYELYEECRGLGLRLGPKDRTEIRNVVILLDSGNKYQAFRYYTIESGSVPDLAWTDAIVERLLGTVQPHVEAAVKRDQIDTSQPVRFKIAMKIM